MTSKQNTGRAPQDQEREAMAAFQADMDSRSDNYFAYDETEQAYILVQTWHMYLHKIRTPKDQFEVRQFRAAVKLDTLPPNEFFAEFNAKSEQALNEKMATQWWYGDIDDDGQIKPFKFNRWFIKDHRAA